MGAKFGVRCAEPIVDHEVGDQATTFVVLIRVETSRVLFVNAGELALRSPRMERFTVLEDVSTALNWTYAFVIVAP